MMRVQAANDGEACAFVYLLSRYAKRRVAIDQSVNKAEDEAASALNA
jgi:hypothetical protein